MLKYRITPIDKLANRLDESDQLNSNIFLKYRNMKKDIIAKFFIFFFVILIGLAIESPLMVFFILSYAIYLGIFFDRFVIKTRLFWLYNGCCINRDNAPKDGVITKIKNTKRYGKEIVSLTFKSNNRTYHQFIDREEIGSYEVGQNTKVLTDKIPDVTKNIVSVLILTIALGYINIMAALILAPIVIAIIYCINRDLVYLHIGTVISDGHQYNLTKTT